MALAQQQLQKYKKTKLSQQGRLKDEHGELETDFVQRALGKFGHLLQVRRPPVNSTMGKAQSR